MRRAGALLLAAALALPLAGCWGRNELEHLAIVTAIALDEGLGKDAFRVSAEMLRGVNSRAPAAGGGGATPEPEKLSWQVSDVGRTPGEALRKIQEHSERHLFFHHSRLIVIGEGLARRGMQPAMDFLDRHPEIRRRSWVLVAKGKTAQETLILASRLELWPVFGVDRQIRSRRFTGTTAITDLRQFLGDLAEAASPRAGVLTNVARPSPEDPLPTQGRPGFRVSGTALFRRDRLVGYLDDEQSRGLLWVLGQVRGGIIVVPCPGETNYFSVAVSRNQSRIRVTGRASRPRIQVRVEGRGDMVGYICRADPTLPGAWERLQDAYATAIQAEIAGALRQAQRLRSDAFGFGGAVHRAFPAEWPQVKPRWDDLFATLPVDLDVRASLETAGQVSRPTLPPFTGKLE